MYGNPTLMWRFPKQKRAFPNPKFCQKPYFLRNCREQGSRSPLPPPGSVTGQTGIDRGILCYNLRHATIWAGLPNTYIEGFVLDSLKDEAFRQRCIGPPSTSKQHNHNIVHNYDQLKLVINISQKLEGWNIINKNESIKYAQRRVKSIILYTYVSPFNDVFVFYIKRITILDPQILAFKYYYFILNVMQKLYQKYSWL